MKAVIGKSVQYFPDDNPDTKPSAAIITDVNDDGTAELTVFRFRGHTYRKFLTAGPINTGGLPLQNKTP